MSMCTKRPLHFYLRFFFHLRVRDVPPAPPVLSVHTLETEATSDITTDADCCSGSGSDPGSGSTSGSGSGSGSRQKARAACFLARPAWQRAAAPPSWPEQRCSARIRRAAPGGRARADHASPENRPCPIARHRPCPRISRWPRALRTCGWSRRPRWVRGVRPRRQPHRHGVAACR